MQAAAVQAAVVRLIPGLAASIKSGEAQGILHSKRLAAAIQVSLSACAHGKHALRLTPLCTVRVQGSMLCKPAACLGGALLPSACCTEWPALRLSAGLQTNPGDSRGASKPCTAPGHPVGADPGPGL